METNIISMKKTEEPITVEQSYSTTVERVWTALTERDQMVQWFFNNIPEFKPIVGFETEFNLTVEDRVFPHLWKVTEVIPKSRITYQWRFGGYEGKAFSTFELFEQDSKTKVKLTFTVAENFQDGINEFTRKSGEQGWSYFIQNSLREFLGD